MNETNLFSSEIVRKEAQRMQELYRSVASRMYTFERMSKEEKQQMFDDMD